MADIYQIKTTAQNGNWGVWQATYNTRRTVKDTVNGANTPY